MADTNFTNDVDDSTSPATSTKKTKGKVRIVLKNGAILGEFFFNIKKDRYQNALSFATSEAIFNGLKDGTAQVSDLLGLIDVSSSEFTEFDISDPSSVELGDLGAFGK